MFLLVAQTGRRTWLALVAASRTLDRTAWYWSNCVLAHCTRKLAVGLVSPNRVGGLLHNAVVGLRLFLIHFYLAAGLQVVRCRCDVLLSEVVIYHFEEFKHKLAAVICLEVCRHTV